MKLRLSKKIYDDSNVYKEVKMNVKFTQKGVILIKCFLVHTWVVAVTTVQTDKRVFESKLLWKVTLFCLLYISQCNWGFGKEKYKINLCVMQRPLHARQSRLFSWDLLFLVVMCTFMFLPFRSCHIKEWWCAKGNWFRTCTTLRSDKFLVLLRLVKPHVRRISDRHSL